ncbi:hypothetical protein BDZ91DRAFT_768775 [Kalaharituber pfeilii]|nr:hypothetical protein BDZ91DRAFT_768775 [Kalaharituber pfeilii]
MSQANVEKIPAPIALPIKPCTHNALRQQVSHSVRQGKGPSIPATASHRDRLGVSTRTRRVPGAFAEPIYSPSKIPLRILGAKLGSPSTYKWNPTKSCTSVRASLSKIPMPMKGHAIKLNLWHPHSVTENPSAHTRLCGQYTRLDKSHFPNYAGGEGAISVDHKSHPIGA